MAGDARAWGAIHHTILVVHDVDASLRFYHDGLGLDILRDIQVYGEWPMLLDAPSRVVRAVFLGDAGSPDTSAGVLELNAFLGDGPEDAPSEGAGSSQFMISFVADIEQTLNRLTQLGVGGHPRRVLQPTVAGDVSIAAVRDPDGVRILLVSGSITQGM